LDTETITDDLDANKRIESYKAAINSLGSHKNKIETELDTLIRDGEKVLKIEIHADNYITIHKLNGGIIRYNCDPALVEIVDHTFENHKRDRRKDS